MPTDPAFIRADHAIHKRFPMMAPKQRAEIVADVLNAIREPDIAMRRVSTFEAAERDWPAMIDAILIQGEGGQRDGVSYDYWLAERAVGSGQTRITPIGTITSATGEVQYPTGEEG